MKMLRTKKTCIGFAAAATLMTLLTGTAPDDEAVEASAERVCAVIGQAGPSSQAAFNIDDLTIGRAANGTVTLHRDDKKLGEIAQSSYVDHTVCFVEVMVLISPMAANDIQAAQRLSPPLRHLD